MKNFIELIYLCSPYILAAAPLLALCVVAFKPSPLVQSLSMLFHAIGHLAAALAIIICAGSGALQIGNLFIFDRLAGYVLLIQSLVFLAVSVYNIDFVHRHEEHTYKKKLRSYHLAAMLFVLAMDGAICSGGVGMFWVFLEASTIVSAWMIIHHSSRRALEATWKYIFICSIGIIFAFIGILLFSTANGGNLDWQSIPAEGNGIFFKIAIPFLVIGFGCKAGLSPMHNWLPDAHSEAPSPISAMLSATLLNAAFAGIIRLDNFFAGSEFEHYLTTLLLVMGFMSIFIPAVYIMKAKDFKRMLAYSSVENMGIIAIGFGLGGAGILGGLIHMAAHSLVKGGLFLTAGNIYSIFHTKRIAGVRNLLRISPVSGILWLLGVVGITGSPPFLTFRSELLVVRQMLTMKYGLPMALLFFGLLTIILGWMFRHVLAMCSPKALSESSQLRIEEDKIKIFFPVSTYFAILGLFIPALIFGFYLPDWAVSFLQQIMERAK